MSQSVSSQLCIIGDGAVGKSSVIQAFRTEGFAPIYKQTIGIDFYEKMLSLPGNTSVSLRVWDVGGQSLNSKSLAQYLASTDAIFMVYDITNIESFDNLHDWLSNIKKYAANVKCIYVVGNKIDLMNLRQVSAEAHEHFVLDNNLNGSLWMSAKTGENVVKAFYIVSGDLAGVKLSSYDLSFHDKVLKAYIHKDDETEARTDWADQIEAEDRAAEERKKLSEAVQCCILA